QSTRSRRAGMASARSVTPWPIEMSAKGPVAKPAGFHHVAVLSAATATNAPPIPRARLPTLSTICAELSVATTTRTVARKIERIVVKVGADRKVGLSDKTAIVSQES